MIGGGIAGIVALQAAGCFDSKTEEYDSTPDYGKLITRYRNGEWHWRTASESAENLPWNSMDNVKSFNDKISKPWATTLVRTAENPGYLECSGCIGGSL